jgi:hypothetical protein
MRRWFGLVLATLLVAVNAYGQTFRGAINGNRDRSLGSGSGGGRRQGHQ